VAVKAAAHSSRERQFTHKDLIYPETARFDKTEEQTAARLALMGTKGHLSMASSWRIPLSHCVASRLSRSPGNESLCVTAKQRGAASGNEGGCNGRASHIRGIDAALSIPRPASARLLLSALL